MAEMIISGEPWISVTCRGELCRCREPAVAKIGEELAFDDPNPARHNLTAYVCAFHFAEALGPAAARQVHIEPIEQLGHGPHCSEYRRACRGCVQEFQAWKEEMKR